MSQTPFLRWFVLGALAFVLVAAILNIAVGIAMLPSGGISPVTVLLGLALLANVGGFAPSLDRRWRPVLYLLSGIGTAATLTFGLFHLSRGRARSSVGGVRFCATNPRGRGDRRQPAASTAHYGEALTPGLLSR